MKLTLVFPYYNNPATLLYQLGIWRSYPDELLRDLEIIIVDDSSATGSRAQDALHGKALPACAFKVLYTVVDVPWNVGGARNLGVHVSANEWTLVTDIDLIVTTGVLASVMSLNPAVGTVYTFKRIHHYSREVEPPHAESKLMTRTDYWAVGGHDESLTGIYAWCDSEFVKRAKLRLPHVELDSALERICYGEIPDAKVSTLMRKEHPEYAQRRQRHTEWKKRECPDQRQVLRLPWAKVVDSCRKRIITAADERFHEIMATSVGVTHRLGYEPRAYVLGRDFELPEAYREYTCGDWPLHIRGKLPYKPQIIRQALRELACPLIWMDADAFALQPLDDVFDGTFDIAVTVRRLSERVCNYPAQYGYINAGVLFFNNTPQVAEFIGHWIETVEQSSSKSDQEALNSLLLPIDPLEVFGSVFQHPCGARIKILSTDEYNWYYWPEPVPSTAKIAHMKTDRRAAALKWLESSGHADVAGAPCRPQ